MVLYFSGVLPLGQGPSRRRRPCAGSPPRTPITLKRRPGKDPEGHELVPVYPTAPGAQPGGPAVAAAQAARKIKYWRLPHALRKSSGISPASDPYAAWTWCRFMKKPRPPPAPPAPARRRQRKSARSSTGSLPWTRATSGISRARPPAAWTWCRFTKRRRGGGPAGAIAVSPATVQSMGVRTAKVEVRPLTHDTWTVGLVTFDERNLSTINTKVNGWVERLYVNATGDPVRRGQTLLSIYSPDLVSAQDEYLLALRNLKDLEKSPVPGNGGRGPAPGGGLPAAPGVFRHQRRPDRGPEEHRPGEETSDPGLAGPGHRHQAHGDPGHLRAGRHALCWKWPTSPPSGWTPISINTSCPGSRWGKRWR